MLASLGAAACVEYVEATGEATSSSGGSGPAASADAATDAALPAIVCDPAEVPVAPALYVSPDGADTNAGTAAAPFRTLGAALASIERPGLVSTVVLAEGEYTSDLVVGHALAGVTVRGGFVHQAATWTRDCADGARDRTTLRADARGLTATSSFGLRTVVLATKSAGASSATGARRVIVWCTRYRYGHPGHADRRAPSRGHWRSGWRGRRTCTGHRNHRLRRHGLRQR